MMGEMRKGRSMQGAMSMLLARGDLMKTWKNRIIPTLRKKKGKS